MSAHATAKINSGWGTFVPGDPLVDVPDATVAAWVEGGVAAFDAEPPEPPRVDDDDPPAPAPRPGKRKGPL